MKGKRIEERRGKERGQVGRAGKFRKEKRDGYERRREKKRDERLREERE